MAPAAAVRAAISAGDWILEPMYQAPSAMPPTSAQDSPENVYAASRPCHGPPAIDRSHGPSSQEALRSLSSAMRGHGKEITHSRRSGKDRQIDVANWSHCTFRENSSSWILSSTGFSTSSGILKLLTATTALEILQFPQSGLLVRRHLGNQELAALGQRVEPVPQVGLDFVQGGHIRSRPSSSRAAKSQAQPSCAGPC